MRYFWPLFFLLFLSTIIKAQINVKGYYRKDGTYVKPHKRNYPNNITINNYSYKNSKEKVISHNSTTNTAKSDSNFYNDDSKYSVYRNPYTLKYRLIEYVENLEFEKSTYEGIATSQDLIDKNKIVFVQNQYPAKTNSFAKLHVTYDKYDRGGSFEPFLVSGTLVEVFGRNKEGSYFIKYQDREGFIIEKELDSVVVRKFDKEKIALRKTYGNIDTSQYTLGIVTADVSVFRMKPETNEANIISKPLKGTIIEVIAHRSNGFWVVKIDNQLGFMLDAFFRLLSDKEVENILNPNISLLNDNKKRGSIHHKPYLPKKLTFLRHPFGNGDSQKGLGITFGFSNRRSIQFDLYYCLGISRYHLGFSRQAGGQKGAYKSQQLSNYGRTIIGSGQYFSTFDFKYSLILYNSISVQVEGNIGSINHYSNYSDKRFKGGGYHLVNSTQSIFGFGGNVGYVWKNGLEVGMGFNSIKGINFDLRATLNNLFK